MILAIAGAERSINTAAAISDLIDLSKLKSVNNQTSKIKYILFSRGCLFYLKVCHGQIKLK